MNPMPLRFALSITILIGLLLPASVKAQDVDTAWQVLGGPVAQATLVAADPNSPDFIIVFLAHSQQRNSDRTPTVSGTSYTTWAPYFSVDGGESWQPASNDLADMEPTTLIITDSGGDSTIWVGTANDGLWRSGNNGRTWRPVRVQELDNQRIIAMTKDTRDRLHIATADNTRSPTTHIYSSDDDGYNWIHRILLPYDGTTANTITDLIADPFQANTLYGVTPVDILISRNAGFSWQRSPIPTSQSASPGELVLTADPTQRGRLYAVKRQVNADGGQFTTVHRSLDGGGSWSELDAQFIYPTASGPEGLFYLSRLRMDPINRGQLLLATNNGLWISNNAGLRWRMAGTSLAGMSVVDIIPHFLQRGRWYVIGPGGLWRTANAGSQWRALTEGLPPASTVSTVLALDDPSQTLIAVGGGWIASDQGTQPIWRSTDQGRSWLPAAYGIPGVSVSALDAQPDQPQLVYGLASNGITRSDNAGRSWQFRPITGVPADVAAGGNENQVFVATSSGVMRSTNRGESWETTLENQLALQVAVSGRSHVYAVTAESPTRHQLWRSQDEGSTWQLMSDLPMTSVNKLITHPWNRNLLLVTTNWQGLWVSPDGGTSWTRSDLGIPAGVNWQGPNPTEPTGPRILDVLISPSNYAEWWAVRDGGGVFRSEDAGRRWTPASSDLGDNLLLSLTEDRQSILAGTSALGVIRVSSPTSSLAPPAEVDVRIEILWPHNNAPVDTASRANIGLRVYQTRSQEVPPCAWTPIVELWGARAAEPMRRIGSAQQRTIDERPFPFWEVNDLDVSWVSDNDGQLILMAKTPASLTASHSSVWIHAVDARTNLPEPPAPTGITNTTPEAVDAIIRVVWPHDEAGNPQPTERANLANISATLFQQNTTLAVAEPDLPGRVWLIGALDTQVGRRLAVGEPRLAQGEGFAYTTFEFNNIDVSLAREPMHHWVFWLEVPDYETTSNIWIHGLDSRTVAARVLEPIAGCQP